MSLWPKSNKMELNVIEYIYRGFKISYKIEPITHQDRGYKAAGHATYLLSKPKSFVTTALQTEKNTYASTEHEIRTSLEKQVDLELQYFSDMKKEICV